LVPSINYLHKIIIIQYHMLIKIKGIEDPPHTICNTNNHYRERKRGWWEGL